jgi:hypothetical protein
LYLCSITALHVKHRTGNIIREDGTTAHLTKKNRNLICRVKFFLLPILIRMSLGFTGNKQPQRKSFSSRKKNFTPSSKEQSTTFSKPEKVIVSQTVHHPPPKVVKQLVGAAIPNTIETVITRDSDSRTTRWRITFQIKSKTLKRLACIA